MAFLETKLYNLYLVGEKIKKGCTYDELRALRKKLYLVHLTVSDPKYMHEQKQDLLKYIRDALEIEKRSNKK